MTGRFPRRKPKTARLRKSRFWTSARVTYLCFASLAFGFVFCVGGRVPYATAAVAVLLPPFSLLYALALSRSIRVTHQLQSLVCERGTQLRYRVAAQNRSLLASSDVRVTLRCDRPLAGLTEEQGGKLLPFASEVWEFTICPMHRGEHKISVRDAYAADPFRLFRLPCRKPGQYTLLSLPILREPPRALRSRLNEITLGESSTLPSDEISVDARPYRPGDPVRRVHWNLTARSRELMVRRFENQNKQRVVCILDLRPAGALPEHEDALIEYALSVLNHTLRQSAPTVLLYAEGEQVRRYMGESLNAFRPMYEALTRVPFGTSLAPSAMLSERGESTYLIYFCIGAADENLVRSLPGNCRADICEIDNGNGIAKRQDAEHIRFIRLEREAET